MEPLIKHTGYVVPLDRINVDTDAIMPKEFIKRIDKSGYGNFIFYHWRYKDSGEEQSNFVLNQDKFKNGSILLTRKNFGCGSSREHAPWGLKDYGFRVIIAPSYGDIFYNNCFKIGILPIILDESQIDYLFNMNSNSTQALKLTVDLKSNKIILWDGQVITFLMESFRKEILLKGLDDIDITNIFEEKINEFEKHHTIFYQLDKK